MIAVKKLKELPASYAKLLLKKGIIYNGGYRRGVQFRHVQCTYWLGPAPIDTRIEEEGEEEGVTYLHLYSISRKLENTPAIFVQRIRLSAGPIRVIFMYSIALSNVKVG